MLNKDVSEILYNSDGTVAGVRSGEGDDAEIALAPLVIGDPSYFPADKKVKTGRIIRTICILNHPVAGVSNADSSMIIIPASQVNRKNDIYITVVGKHHEVAAKGRYVAIVATTVETATPEKEVEAGIQLLGEMVTRFNNIVDTYAPVENGRASKAFITKSYDATSHFEATTDEILEMYNNIFGEAFDLTKPVALPEAE
jgi:Rab GDP dissociation inhibitor